MYHTETNQKKNTEKLTHVKKGQSQKPSLFKHQFRTPVLKKFEKSYPLNLLDFLLPLLLRRD